MNAVNAMGLIDDFAQEAATQRAGTAAQTTTKEKKKNAEKEQQKPKKKKEKARERGDEPGRRGRGPRRRDRGDGRGGHLSESGRGVEAAGSAGGEKVDHDSRGGHRRRVGGHSEDGSSGIRQGGSRDEFHKG